MKTPPGTSSIELLPAAPTAVQFTVRFAAGDEDFTPLGEPDITEHPRPGEVIYTDAKSVLTRHWNHRDADRTKVTEDSARIVFLLETTDAPNFGPAVEAAGDGLHGGCGSRTRKGPPEFKM